MTGSQVWPPGGGEAKLSRLRVSELVGARNVHVSCNNKHKVNTTAGPVQAEFPCALPCPEEITPRNESSKSHHSDDDLLNAAQWCQQRWAPPWTRNYRPLRPLPCLLRGPIETGVSAGRGPCRGMQHEGEFAEEWQVSKGK